MSQYPGVTRTFISYLEDSLRSTLGIIFIMGITCVPVFIFYGFVGGEFLGYTLFSFMGLCVYFGQLEVKGSLNTVNSATESRIATRVLRIFMVVYYNVVVFVGAFIATTLSIAGRPEIALSVAVLYPIYDAEMAKDPLPISIAGGTASALLFVAWLVEWGQDLLDLEVDHELAEQFRTFSSTKSILRDYFIEEFERRRSGGVTP